LFGFFIGNEEKCRRRHLNGSIGRLLLIAGIGGKLLLIVLSSIS
jgi:hypothetical protein